MKPIQRLILRLIFRSLVVQGYSHRANVLEVYRILRAELEKQFPEDSPSSLKGFSTELHEEAYNVR